ncbi:MAG: hypothetical protein EOO43_22825 [Flavobacterium sp.]|nr:MAG: hypothetical protein EOO43_22825 [Flavobacterium sp.]
MINGKVLDLATNQPLPDAVAYLVDTSSTIDTLIADPDNYYFKGIWGHKILSKAKIDSNGLFSFTVIPNKSYTLCVSHRMPYIYFGDNKTDSGYSYREDFVDKITLTEQDKFYKVFYLMVTCPFDKTKGQSFCPVCNKSDRVVPIIFGLPAYDENGNIPGTPDQYHLGGCFVDAYCDPTKHCKRCKKDF